MNKYYKPFEEFIQDFKTNPDKYPEEDKVVASLSVSGDESKDESSSDEADDDEDDEDRKPVKTIPKVSANDDDDDDSDDMFDDSDESSDDASSYDETKEGRDFIAQFIKKK